METFLQLLVQYFFQLMPVVRVVSYERGVRWTWGRNPHELKPGIRLRIPGVHSVEAVSVVDTYLALHTQSVITKDVKLVCFAVAIGYKITDPVAHFCEVTDFEEAVEAISQMHLAKRVAEKTWDELSRDRAALEKSLEGTLTTQVKSWGTKIIDVGFTDIALVPRQYRIFGGNITL